MVCVNNPTPCGKDHLEIYLVLQLSSLNAFNKCLALQVTDVAERNYRSAGADDD